MVLTVALAVIASHVIGWFWYSNAGFGKKWAALTGVTMPDPKNPESCKGMGTSMVVSILLSIVTASIVYSLIYKYGMELPCVFAAWVALSFPLYASAALWERKSWKLVWLNTAQGLISFGAMVGIIYWMM